MDGAAVGSAVAARPPRRVDPGPLPDGLVVEEAAAPVEEADDDSATLKKRMMVTMFAFAAAVFAGSSVSGRARR